MLQQVNVNVSSDFNSPTYCFCTYSSVSTLGTSETLASNYGLSDEVEDSMTKLGVRYPTTAAYHTVLNDLADRVVQTVKNDGSSQIPHYRQMNDWGFTSRTAFWPKITDESWPPSTQYRRKSSQETRSFEGEIRPKYTAS